jgi:hypothetical protein
MIDFKNQEESPPGEAFLFWSRIALNTVRGTCSKEIGSIEYDARPFERDRIAVA